MCWEFKTKTQLHMYLIYPMLGAEGAGKLEINATDAGKSKKKKKS